MSSSASETGDSLKETLSSVASTAGTAASSAISAISTTLSASASLLSTTATHTTPGSTTTTKSSFTVETTTSNPSETDRGIGIVSFLTALAVAMVVFAVQVLVFLMLRNKLARIFKPKTYLVPERERTESPPTGIFGMLRTLWSFSDREIINKCGLDAYFFLRYLRTLLVIFLPIGTIVMPILLPLNYIDGIGHEVDIKDDDSAKNSTTIPTGLDTLAWGNVSPKHTSRYDAHLLMAILVIIWVCTVFFFELRVYIKVRQDYLTTAEHRLRASATTVLVNSIPSKWLSEEALRGLFDVFPGGIRNVWLNRDLSTLLEKISKRNKVHEKLEKAQTELIKDAKKAQLKMRNAEEKKQRKQMKLGTITKEEKAARDAQEDEEAKKMANSSEGHNAGDQHNVPHSVDAGIRESRIEGVEDRHSDSQKRGLKFLGDPFAKVGHGIKGVVSKAGYGVEDTLETTNGFIGMPGSNDRPPTRSSDRYYPSLAVGEEAVGRPSASDTLRQLNTHSRNTSRASNESTSQVRPKPSMDPMAGGNTVRTLTNIEDLYDMEETKWWQFWKPPAGGYASPVPQGAPLSSRAPAEKRPFYQKLPFMKPDEEPQKYDLAHDADYKEEDDGPAEWEKYLKKKDRPTHRLPLFGKSWLFGVPLITEKVDTIYWCREELARLNLEIEEDQKHPDRFPLMNSAFIQFNHQVAAHMACQCTTHHVPKQMAPRMNEISPKDVIWDNMAIPWWQGWMRTAAVTTLVSAMIFLWAIPVAFTAALSQLDTLIQQNEWLSFIKDNSVLESAAKAIAGVLPAVVLGLLLFLVPHILNFLAGIKGVKTGAERVEFVQIFYFAFLFIQVFLIVSVASFFAASLDTLVNNVKQLQTVQDVLNLLAVNIPSAANYFFSYMILQAMSTSSGTLLQIGALLMWYVIARILDSTARSKWARNTKLNAVKWGAFFPIYTNFACIALVYCIIAPLISIFAIITFGLLWIAQRYAMLYVTRFENDTGGVLYPRAINQTFTGIYVMEACMAGLFFLVDDEHGKNTCTTHGIIMIVVLILTVGYQVLLNMSFGPLFRYLPITFEDEAVLRDEAFQRAQDRRLGLLEEEEESGDDSDNEGVSKEKARNVDGVDGSQSIEMERFGSIRRPARQVGHWAKDGGSQLKKLAHMNKSKDKSRRASEYRRNHRRQDLEAQRAIGDALFGGIHDEIEDLTPEERDILTQHAFKHEALRARQPAVWIPRDDLGVSDDEVRRTERYSEHIWISNEGTALDSKVRVVYGKAPPDFSEVDLINL